MWVNVPCPVHRLAAKALAKTLVLNLQNIVANGTMFSTNDIMETDDFPPITPLSRGWMGPILAFLAKSLLERPPARDGV